jgi:ASC-1-like (ASCH) protein
MNHQDSRALLEECLRLNGELCLPSIGSSMWPDLRNGDELRLKQIGFEDIQPGDIVLFQNEHVLVAHRVLKTYVESGRAMLLLKGDNRTFADPPVFYEQVVGRVDEASRSGKVIYRRDKNLKDRWVAWRSHQQERFWNATLDRTLGKGEVLAETRAIYQLVAYNLGFVAEPLLEDGLDWERLYAQAVEGRLTAVLANKVIPGAPAWFRGRCERDLIENQAHQLLLYQQLEAMLRAFEEAGIQAMVVKGPVVADTVYPHPGWRPMVDLDLVVKDEDWAASVEVLTKLGFDAEQSGWSGLTEELTGQVSMLKSVGPAIAAVELHRDLAILSERLAVRGEVNLPRAWAETQPYVCGTARALALSPEDAIAYASTHWAQHHFFSSIWLVDIALMAAQPNLHWDKLVRQAHADGTAYFLWSALFLVHSLFGAPVPGEVLTALQPPFPKGPMIRHMVWVKALTSFHERPDARSLMLQLLLFVTWRWTIAGLLNGIFPSAQWLRQHYEPEAPAAHGPRLMLRHWGNLLRLLMR